MKKIQWIISFNRLVIWLNEKESGLCRLTEAAKSAYPAVPEINQSPNPIRNIPHPAIMPL